MTYRLHVEGDTDAAKQLLPTARKELAVLKNQMKFAGLGQDQRTVVLSSGAIIHVESRLGQDTINIEVPEIEEELVEEVKEEPSISLMYKIKITNIKTGNIVDTTCLMRMAVYSKDATDLEDEDNIFFDYKVPTDVDVDGNLLIEPEEYFGSDENPGLDWDDDNECFIIASEFIENTMLDALSYAEASGADELNHFLVYSCKDCVLDKYKKARTNQQYPEIVDDDERWNEDNLVELGLGDEILEDNMACVIQSFLVAQLGVWRTIWDAVTGGYAQGIIDDADDEILDADWPVHVNDITNFLIATSIGGAASSFGTEFDPYQYPNFGVGSPADCEEGFSWDKTLPSLMVEDCEEWYLGSSYDCDVPTGGNTTILDTLQHWCASASYYTFWSVHEEVNNFDVIIRSAETRQVQIDYFVEPIGSPRLWNRDYYHKRSFDIITPWGNVFDDTWVVYTDYEGSGDISVYPSGTCSGFSWTEDDTYDEEDKMESYHYKSDNIIFFCITSVYFLNKYNVTKDPAQNNA